MAALARRMDCLLATGERDFTLREFAQLAELQAVSSIQPDLSHCAA